MQTWLLLGAWLLFGGVLLGGIIVLKFQNEAEENHDNCCQCIKITLLWDKLQIG